MTDDISDQLCARVHLVKVCIDDSELFDAGRHECAAIT